MESFIFRLLNEFGAGLTVVAVVLILVWRVFPKVADVWIDKTRAETSLIQATQAAVTTSIPKAIDDLNMSHLKAMGDLRSTFITEHKATVMEIKSAIGTETDKRIEEKLTAIERRVARSPLETDAPPPPSRSPAPSRPSV